MVLNLLIDNPAIRVIGPQVFPFMRVVKLVRTGVKITKSTNPISVGATLHFASQIYDNC